MGKVVFLDAANNSHTLEGVSRAISRVITNGGIVGDDDLLVTENGTPDKDILIADGNIFIGENSPQDSQEDYYYLGIEDSGSASITISDNTSGSTRYDAIIAKVNTSGGASDDNDGALVFQAVEGTPGADAPTDAEIESEIGAGVPFLVLAHVELANNFTTISNSEITDMRVKANTNARTQEDNHADFVASGLVWSQDSGLVGTMTSGYAYIGGRLVSKSTLLKTFTASKDTYVDLPAGSYPTNEDDLTYTAVSNGAAAPALAAGSIRLAKVVTDGSGITSVVQTSIDNAGENIYNTNPQKGTRVVMLPAPWETVLTISASSSVADTDLDLAGKVSANATHAILKVSNPSSTNVTNATYIRLGAKGSTDNDNSRFTCYAAAANGYRNTYQITCPLDSNQEAVYKVNANSSSFSCTVELLGYIESL